MSPAYRQRLFVALAARSFGFLALLGPAAWARDDVGVLAIAAVGVIWAIALIVEAVPRPLVLTTELVAAALVGIVCGLAAGTSTTALGALAISPLTAGVFRGARAALGTLAVSTAALVVAATIADGGLAFEGAVAGFTWTTTGLGLGFIGASLHGTLLRTDPLATQRRVQSLIRRLIHESEHLVSGHEPETLGAAILEQVRAVVPAATLLIQAPHDGVLAPVALDAGALAPPDELATVSLADRAYAEGRPVRSVDGFALPLTSEGRVVAVVSGWFLPGVDVEAAAQLDLLSRLAARLEGPAIDLETALLFATFRTMATVEERRRLARELHDGVAQDLASLGYLVDAIAAGNIDPTYVGKLRNRLTGVLEEVRRSLVTLRADSGRSLGAGLDDLVRSLGPTTDIALFLALDEGPARLRPEVEAELYRITQEAIINALRHSGARTVQVRCRVDAPSAKITVIDDGRGLADARPDSHGLQIMQERARLVGADLQLTTRPGGGVVVQVRLPAGAAATASSTRKKVTA